MSTPTEIMFEARTVGTNPSSRNLFSSLSFDFEISLVLSRLVSSTGVAVMRRFFDYDWPGNVRQLRNVVENMVVLDIDEVLDLDDLPPDLEVAESKEIDASVNEGPGNLIGCPMDVIERWAITETLKLTNGNREEAARILGIGARTLYRKLDKYGKD